MRLCQTGQRRRGVADRERRGGQVGGMSLHVKGPAGKVSDSDGAMIQRGARRH